MSESNEVIRDARKLGLPKMLILGLQHMFAMFGATILVPILVNSYFVDACGERTDPWPYGSSDPVLCRIWNPVIPCVFQDESSGFLRFFLCILRRIFHSCTSGYRNLCWNECQ